MVDIFALDALPATFNFIPIMNSLFYWIITGSTASRANFQRMMADATGPNPPFDEVVIYDLPRFSRDTVDSLTYPRILQAHGIGFHSVKDNFSSDASGRLHMTLIAGVNEFHNYKTAEGSSRGQADAPRMGYYTGQRAPLGLPEGARDGRRKGTQHPGD